MAAVTLMPTALTSRDHANVTVNPATSEMDFGARYYYWSPGLGQIGAMAYPEIWRVGS